jgi:hypothetical protein
MLSAEVLKGIKMQGCFLWGNIRDENAMLLKLWVKD